MNEEEGIRDENGVAVVRGGAQLGRSCHIEVFEDGRDVPFWRLFSLLRTTGKQPLPSLPPVERRLFINHVTQSYSSKHNLLTDATSSLSHFFLNTTY